MVGPLIKKIRKWTDVPICLDTEGAQIRNQKMNNDRVLFRKDQIVKIHFEEVLGDEENISFTPINIARQYVVGDIIGYIRNSQLEKTL